MDISIPLDILAVGNKRGKLFVYNLSGSQPQRSKKFHEESDCSSDEAMTVVYKEGKPDSSRGKLIPEKFESSSPTKADVVLSHPRYEFYTIVYKFLHEIVDIYFVSI